MCTLFTKLHSNLGIEQFNSTQRRQRLKDPSNLASSFKQSLVHKRRGCSSGNKRIYKDIWCDCNSLKALESQDVWSCF